MKNHYWLNSTVTRTTSVVSVNGFGMAHACPPAVGFMSDTATLKRHANAIKATPAMGLQPWSPLVT